ncbi:hypothetical protein FRB94_000121 [Tulasnella sp. JGI-2019a]|nr:hypothetical protein FRB94_000121 [Tulasnella sp. JGI-2019a]
MSAFGKFLGAGIALARGGTTPLPAGHRKQESLDESNPQQQQQPLSPSQGTSSFPEPKRSQSVKEPTPAELDSSGSFSHNRTFSAGDPPSPTTKEALFKSFLAKKKEQQEGSGRAGHQQASSSSSAKWDLDGSGSREPRSRSPSLPSGSRHTPPLLNHQNASSSRAGPSKSVGQRYKPPLQSLSKVISASDGLKPSPATSQPTSGSSTTWRNADAKLNIKDELLMSLLASQAMVDSRDSEILTAEDVDELKRELSLVNSRVTTAARKVSVETRIRDAALALHNLDNHHSPTNHDAIQQLQAANQKLEMAQQELFRVSDRANQLTQRLLEHRAGVLSFNMRSLEKRAAVLTSGNGAGRLSGSTDDTESEGSSTELGGEMSPASTAATSLSIAPPRKFDGAHLFAGHADAVVPGSLANSRAMGMASVRAMEHRLKQAQEAMEEGKKHITELEREVDMLGGEKAEMEMKMGRELTAARETIGKLEHEMENFAALTMQVAHFEDQRREWERDKRDMEGRLRAAEQALPIQQAKSVETEEALIQLRAEVLSKDSENKRLLEERKAWEKEKESLRQSLIEYQAGATEELIVAREALRSMCRHNKVVDMPQNDAKLIDFVQALEGHISTFDQAKDEMVGSREGLLNQLEDARKEREDARKEARALETRLKESDFDRSSLPSMSRRPSGHAPAQSIDSDQVLAILKPVWSILPSVEIRASRLGINARATTPRSPKMRSDQSSSSISSLTGQASPPSLSELDVRSLKALYDPKGPYMSPTVAGEFSLEEFAMRVQALITDDRALVERLLRFAQAHDLLKTNAERAQRLAQESSMGLQTYQKQVSTLEERCQTLTAKQTALLDEIDELQVALLNEEAEKRELAIKAETALKTASAMATPPPPISSVADTDKIERLQLQIYTLEVDLKKVNDELERTRMAESTQRVMLMDELNGLQEENGALRNQLRNKK